MTTKLNSRMIECEYDCGCWFDFEISINVTQSCMYHNKKLLMRSDAKKDFANNKEETKVFNKTAPRKK